jgi:O-antigen ligase
VTSSALTLDAGGQTSRAATSGAATKADFLCWVVWGLGLVNVWRIQVLYAPVLSPLRLGLVFTLLALVAWVMANDGWRRWARVQTVGPVRTILLLFGVILLGVPLGLYPGSTLDFIRNTYFGILLYFLFTVASIRSKQDVERILLVHVIGASVYSLVVFTRFDIGPSGRLGHLLSYDANDVAMLLVCTMPITVYFMRKGASPLLRALMIGAFALFAILMVRSGSRGGFIGFIATMTYLLFRFRGIKLQVRVAAIAVGVGTVLVVGSDRYWELMSTLLNPKEDYNYTSAGGRKAIWERGIGYMLHRPIAGVGVNNFGVAEGGTELNRLRVAEGKGWIWAAPHNSFVQMGAETGVTGLALFIATLVAVLKYTMRRTSRGLPEDGDDEALRGALAGALVAYCFAGFFLTQGHSAYLYSLLGVVAGLMKIQGQSGSAPLAPIVSSRRSVRVVARGLGRAPTAGRRSARRT